MGEAGGTLSGGREVREKGRSWMSNGPTPGRVGALSTHRVMLGKCEVSQTTNPERTTTKKGHHSLEKQGNPPQKSGVFWS